MILLCSISYSDLNGDVVDCTAAAADDDDGGGDDDDDDDDHDWRSMGQPGQVVLGGRSAG